MEAEYQSDGVYEWLVENGQALGLEIATQSSQQLKDVCDNQNTQLQEQQNVCIECDTAEGDKIDNDKEPHLLLAPVNSDVAVPDLNGLFARLESQLSVSMYFGV